MLRYLAMVLALTVVTVITTDAQAQIKAEAIKGELKGKEEVVEKELKKDAKYIIRLNSDDFDTYLYIRDAKNQEVAKNDDAGGSLNSALKFSPTESGKYKLVAGSFMNQGTGKYTLEIIETAELQPKGKAISKKGKITKEKTFKGLPFASHNIKMKKGSAYEINFKSEAFDPIMVIRRKGEEKPLDIDDDGGDGLNSKLLFYPSQDEEFEIMLGSLNKKEGDYTLEIQEYTGK